MYLLDFSNSDSVREFCNKYYVSLDNVRDAESRKKIMQFQNRPIIRGKDDSIISEINSCIGKIAPAPCDFVIYRSGSMKKRSNRPYVGATFLKNVAKRYNRHAFLQTHKIVVRKGAKLIPMLAINLPLSISLLDDERMEFIKAYDDPDCDIILDSSRIKWCGSYYEYR